MGGKQVNEELTREVLEDMATCRERGCPDCKGVCRGSTMGAGIETLARALLAEMDKPKVWDGAPEWATIGRACWTDKKHGEAWSTIYRRDLPKSRARQIAEQEGYVLAEKYGWNASAKELVTNVMEAALTKYAEELEEKESN